MFRIFRFIPPNQCMFLIWLLFYNLPNFVSTNNYIYLKCMRHQSLSYTIRVFLKNKPTYLEFPSSFFNIYIFKCPAGFKVSFSLSIIQAHPYCLTLKHHYHCHHTCVISVTVTRWVLMLLVLTFDCRTCSMQTMLLVKPFRDCVFANET